MQNSRAKQFMQSKSFLTIEHHASWPSAWPNIPGNRATPRRSARTHGGDWGTRCCCRAKGSGGYRGDCWPAKCGEPAMRAPGVVSTLSSCGGVGSAGRTAGGHREGSGERDHWEGGGRRVRAPKRPAGGWAPKRPMEGRRRRCRVGRCGGQEAWFGRGRPAEQRSGGDDRRVQAACLPPWDASVRDFWQGRK